MRSYEIMFIVRPDLEEGKIKETVIEVEKIIKSNSIRVINSKDLGQKELAYTIEKHKTGYYHLFKVSGSVDGVKELDRLMRINENIIRFMIIKLEE